MPAFVKLEYPKVFVDIDRLLKERNIRGIQVRDIVFEDDQFTIVTARLSSPKSGGARIAEDIG
jgi:hypothetical protein